MVSLKPFKVIRITYNRTGIKNFKKVSEKLLTKAKLYVILITQRKKGVNDYE